MEARIEKNHLNSAYMKFMRECVVKTKEEHISRWETFFDIITELEYIDKHDEVKEIKYRLTDGDNPCEVMIEVIDRIEATPLLRSFRMILEDYIEDDEFSRFQE
jgi:hypothetical protein